MITNYFSPLEFQVNVARLPNVEFFVQRTAIPSVSATPATMPTPFNRLNFTPDKLEYGQFDLTFIVDENMENYIEVLNWIKGTTFPERYTQFEKLANSPEKIFSDITIVTLNSHKLPTIRITFSDCQPITLSEVVMDTRDPDVQYSEATVSFAYNHFDVSKYIDE